MNSFLSKTYLVIDVVVVIVVMVCLGNKVFACTPRVSVDLVSVTDGDTIRVNIPNWPEVVGKNMPVRIQGIDTPEIRKSACPEEKALGVLATEWVRLRLLSADRLEISYPERGSFFRFIAEVYVDGSPLSQELISAGYAVPYQKGDNPDWCH